eukprot:m.334980 g.334980  ORF g.334980 m.334980 type:complete len:835 (-) comp17487_c0_seq1:123-2627(-)
MGRNQVMAEEQVKPMVVQHQVEGETPIRQVNIGPLRFNPTVTLYAFVLLWGIAIYCMADEENAKADLEKMQEYVVDEFTWLYIATQDFWIIFCVYLYFSRFGSKKMCEPGEEDKPPEFSNSSYFMMLFTCGVAVGMFFFGVTEPLNYYTYGTRYVNADNTQTEVAQWAITLTVFHWGLHGWIPYCLVGLAVGFASYRQGKPLTMRTTLYPLLGDRMSGWLGDVIDIISIFTVVAGVCTSLALGTQQIAAGIYRLDTTSFNITDEDERKDAWTLIIACITLVACLSVVSGINNGIKTLSTIAFGLAMIILMMVFLMDDTVFFLDIMVQTVGHYLQYIIELGWITDAFQRQFTHGTTDNPDYLFPGAPADMYEGGSPTRGGNPLFMSYWTIFYWGWWIAWSPFVGMFIARISKGRTVREVFNYCMIAPLIYVILWFAVFGGAGIKMHNSAIECRDSLPARAGVCQVVEGPLGRQGYAIYNPMGDPAVNSSVLAGFEEDLPDTYERDLSRRIVYEFKYDSTNNFFEVLEQYYGWGEFLSGLTIATIILYFVTSSDSGSLVVDIISAGGHRDRDPHWIQRVVWSLTEGALAIGLMRAGGGDGDGAKALRAISIAAGLPYTIVLSLMCTSLYRMLLFDDGLRQREQYLWRSMPLFGGVLDILEVPFSLFGLCDLKTFNFSKWTGCLVDFALGLIFPSYHVYKTLENVNKIGTEECTTLMDSTKTYNGAMALGVFAMEICFIVGHSVNPSHGGWYAFAWTAYCMMVLLMAMVRAQTRYVHSIDGNLFEDFFSCFFLPFNAGPQYYGESLLEVRPKPNKDDIKDLEMIKLESNNEKVVTNV